MFLRLNRSSPFQLPGRDSHRWRATPPAVVVEARPGCRPFPRYQKLAEMAYTLAVPPPQPQGEWHAIGESLVQAIEKAKIDSVAKTYARIGDAYRADNRPLFNQQV